MSNYKPCPDCSNENPEAMSFTWWGGLIGPKILSHVKCTSCGKQYNGKSGKENTVGIIIYSIIVGAIVLGLLIFVIALAIIVATMN